VRAWICRPPSEHGRRDPRPSWPASSWAAEGRKRWEQLDAGHVSLPVGSFCWLAAFYAESAGYSAASSRLPPVRPFAHGGAVLGLTGLLVVINGWLMDRYLADHTVMERELPRWLRGVRAVTAGVPVLGLYAVATWRRLLDQQPAWLQARRHHRRMERPLELRYEALPARAGPGLARRIDGLRRRAGESTAGLMSFLVLCQSGPAIVAMNWLAESASSPAPPRLPLLVATSGLRLVAGVSAFVYSRYQIRRRQLFGARARLLLAPAAFVLLPFPFSLLAIPAWIPLLSVHREQRTLVHAAHARGPESARLRQRLAGARPGRGSAGADAAGPRSAVALVMRAPDIGGAEQRRRAFYRLKTLLLFLDAAALGWVLARYRGFGPVLLSQPFSRVLLAFLAPCGLGLLIEGAGLAASLKGGGGLADLWRRHPYGRFVAMSQSTFVAGLISGALLATGASHTLGLVLSTVAMFDLLVLFCFWLTAGLAQMPGSSTPVVMTWMVFFAAVVGAGALLRGGAAMARPVIGLLGWAMALTPLCHLALALGMTGSLVRPARLRQVVSGRLAAGTRTVPALVALTAALPLGGLAIPFWIYARQRWWPEYERRWGSLAS
jgi:hypothetical protein